MLGVDPRVLLALVVVQLIFGLNHAIAKSVLRQVSPFALAALRVIVSTPLLLAWAWRSEHHRPALRELPGLALLGLTGVFANQVLFLEGLQRTTAINAAILMPVIPVFAAGLSLALRIERFAPLRLLGVVLAVGGALIMLRPHRFSLGEGTVTGNLLLLGNGVSFAIFLVLQRPMLARIPWRTLLAWAFLFGGLMVLAVTGPALLQLPLSLPPRIWAGIAYVAVLATGVAYLLNTWAVARSSPTPVAVSITLQPLVAAVAAAIFLGETPGPIEVTGFVLIGAGVLLSSRGKPDPAPVASVTPEPEPPR